MVFSRSDEPLLIRKKSMSLREKLETAQDTFNSVASSEMIEVLARADEEIAASGVAAGALRAGIGTDGRVAMSFVDANYGRRIEPSKSWPRWPASVAMVGAKC
jgi:hypothetical protein